MPRVKIEEKKESAITISKERALKNISQWLYVYDGAYPNKSEWRRELLIMLEFNIGRLE